LTCRIRSPGGNLTGINFFNAELTAKRLELLRELVPGAVRVAVIVNPAGGGDAEATLRDVEPAARTMGLQLHVLSADRQSVRRQ
jgi:putative ABC transport system substrate-binding protein